MAEKLQKILAQRGLGSRRLMESWITAGRIQVNGQPAHLGQRVELSDQLVLDGQPLPIEGQQTQSRQLLLYHKPVGQICTRFDPEGRPTVFECLPALAQGKWIAVGRLDFNTSGLLLFTNEGTFANELMHPRNGYVRVYKARVRGKLSSVELARLQSGVPLEDGWASFAHVASCQEGSGLEERHNSWYQVRVYQGRNRIVRRLFEALGYEVSKLIRIQYGPWQLPATLASGHYLAAKQ